MSGWFAKEKDKKTLKVTPEVLAKFEVNKDDLLAIAVSKHEENLEQEKKEVDASLRALVTQEEKLREELVTSIREDTEETLKAPGEGAISALGMSGFKKISYEIKSSLVKPDPKSPVEFSDDPLLGLEDFGNLKNIYYRLTLIQQVDRNYASNQSIFFSMGHIALSQNHKVLIENIRTSRKKITEVQRRAVEVRGELANLTKKERQVKARLASRILEQTEEGRDLLETIGFGSFETKALPLDKNTT